MEQWLNWYATVIAEGLCKSEAEQGRHCGYDVERIFSEFATESVRFMKRPGAERDNSGYGELYWFGERIAPFVGHFSQKPPLAIALEPGAVFDLHETIVDEEIRGYAQQALARHSTVYLDIPDRAYMMRGGVFQVRALFIWQRTEGNRFCAILTRPGSNRGWRIAWLEGHHARSARHSAFDDVWAMPSSDIADRYRPINFGKIDYSELVEVEKLAWGSLACWQDSVGDHNAPIVEIPQLHREVREQPLDIERDPPLTEEQFSLFKIARIRNVNPARIRGISERVSAAGHTRCRHAVKEFWRWQACGKGRKERRWTKVAGHMRGRGTLKTPMHVIRSANPAAAI